MEDKELMNVAYSSGLRYKESLTLDEIENCIINALWRTAEKYDDEREDKCKIETYIYNGVNLECLNYLERVVRPKQFPPERGTISRHINSVYHSEEDIDCIDELEHSHDPELMFGRFYENYTLQELGDQRGISKQAISKKIEKNLELIKHRLN